MNGTTIYNLLDGYIEAEVNRKLNLRLDELLDTLVETYPEYRTIITETVKQQRYPVQSVLRLDTEKKRRRKKNIDPACRCMARTGLDTQCLRPRVPQTRYCQSHSYSLPYDDIEAKVKVDTQKIVKKRGRRGKGKQFILESLDQTKYVQSVVVQLGDVSYLVDENDVIYNFNQNNEIVGYIKDEQAHWF
jgi:hypothetical protein